MLTVCLPSFPPHYFNFYCPCHHSLPTISIFTAPSSQCSLLQQQKSWIIRIIILIARTSHSSTLSVSADSGKEIPCRRYGNSQSPLTPWSFYKEHKGINKLRKIEKHTVQKKTRMENWEKCHSMNWLPLNKEHCSVIFLPITTWQMILYREGRTGLAGKRRGKEIESKLLSRSHILPQITKNVFSWKQFLVIISYS